MGGFEPRLSGWEEPPVKYHPFLILVLTRDQALGPCLVGSLTGAVASQKVTEAFKGPLSTDGNRASSALA